MRNRRLLTHRGPTLAMLRERRRVSSHEPNAESGAALAGQRVPALAPVAGPDQHFGDTWVAQTAESDDLARHLIRVVNSQQVALVVGPLHRFPQSLSDLAALYRPQDPTVDRDSDS